LIGLLRVVFPFFAPLHRFFFLCGDPDSPSGVAGQCEFGFTGCLTDCDQDDGTFFSGLECKGPPLPQIGAPFEDYPCGPHCYSIQKFVTLRKGLPSHGSFFQWHGETFSPFKLDYGKGSSWKLRRDSFFLSDVGIVSLFSDCPFASSFR